MTIDVTNGSGRLRILLVGDFPDDPRLGSAKVLHKLRTEFLAAGHECRTLLAPAIGARPRQRHARDAVGPLLAAAAIGRAFRADGPYDVVDVAGAEGAMFGLFRRAGVHARTAFVSRSNGLEHRNYQRLLDDHTEGLIRKPWARRLWYPSVRLTQVATAARTADRLLVLTESDRQFASSRRWKPDDAIDVVPHGISASLLGSRDVLLAERGGGLLFCGSWDAVKGVPYLVQALGLLVAARVRFTVTILGGGLPPPRILATFPLDVRPLVTVVDRVPEDQVMEHFARHDLLVFPSTYEGFGMVVPEAMSQGLPVVATPTGVAATLIRHEETGLLVPPRDAAALAGAIRRLLGDADLRRRIAARAFDEVQSMTWAATATRTIEVYRRAIASAREA